MIILKPKWHFLRVGFLVISIIYLFQPILTAQDFLGFKEVIIGPTPAPNHPPELSVKPSNVEVTTQGGTFEASIKYKQSATEYCTARYRFEWRFSEPVDKLFKGQPVDIEFKATLLSAPCKAGTGKTIVMAASGASPQFKESGIRYAGGLSVKPTKWIQVGSTNTETFVSTINVLNPSVQYATFKFNFESSGYVGSERLHYEAVYVFEKGLHPKINCDPDLNCHNLYSVGVLIGFAEYGAFKNDDPKFLAEQLDGAIIHAEASKCVPTEKLRQMSSKLKQASSSKPFHNELTNLRDEIARYVEKNCNCCSK